jgi:hypothetical protein
MKTFWALVKTSPEPGSQVVRVTIESNNAYTAYSLLKAKYGNLLVSGSAFPV